MKNITVLGSTGSIGMSTLEVLSLHPEKYSIYALTAHSSVEKLVKQCLLLKPRFAVVGNASAARAMSVLLRDKSSKTEILYGKDALCQVARADECHTVIAAIVGAAGLAPTLAAVKASKKILLANKESIVMSGQIFIDSAKESGALLLPIDSEHNAIFQCLPYGYQCQSQRFGVEKIILTASGGPFLNRPIEQMDTITPQEAICHPNWVMGRKISVDSATMMNKGLEIIEAHWLFGISVQDIEVVIHPQSIVHSMVSYTDGSVIAQLSNPDMRVPIAHALAYPERVVSGALSLDLTAVGRLEFSKPDLQRFPCLKFAYDALLLGGSAPAVLNASNEVAVQNFLDGRIGFFMIPQVIAYVMDRMPLCAISDIDSLIEQDTLARQAAHSFLRMQ